MHLKCSVPPFSPGVRFKSPTWRVESPWSNMGFRYSVISAGPSICLQCISSAVEQMSEFRACPGVARRWKNRFAVWISNNYCQIQCDNHWKKYDKTRNEKNLFSVWLVCSLYSKLELTLCMPVSACVRDKEQATNRRRTRSNIYNSTQRTPLTIKTCYP